MSPLFKLLCMHIYRVTQKTLTEVWIIITRALFKIFRFSKNRLCKNYLFFLWCRCHFDDYIIAISARMFMQLREWIILRSSNWIILFKILITYLSCMLFNKLINLNSRQHFLPQTQLGDRMTCTILQTMDLWIFLKQIHLMCDTIS